MTGHGNQRQARRADGAEHDHRHVPVVATLEREADHARGQHDEEQQLVERIVGEAGRFNNRIRRPLGSQRGHGGRPVFPTTGA